MDGLLYVLSCHQHMTRINILTNSEFVKGHLTNAGPRTLSVVNKSNINA